MATTGALPFSCFLLLFFSFSHLSHCSAAPTQPEVSSARAAAIQYWNLKFPTSRPLPPFFLSKLSNLSIVQLATNFHTSRPHATHEVQGLGSPNNNVIEMVTIDAGSSDENGATSSNSDHQNATTSGDVGPSDESRPSYSYHGPSTASGDVGPSDKNRPSYSYHGSRSTSISRNKAYNVPPGFFFREHDLKAGTVMPVRFIEFLEMSVVLHFLPRSISSEIPFSASAIKKIFQLSPADAATNKALDNAIAHCKMPPNVGETKRCVASAEDMMDFVLESLGSDNVQVKSTNNSNGLGRDIMIGDVKAVNGGRFAEIISCHRLKLPYLAYNCHHVPKIRVYEADLLEIGSKKKINHATVICHMDTSTWSAAYDAFIALGPAPGKIEVCHWISPHDMAWTVAAAAE